MRAPLALALLASGCARTSPAAPDAAPDALVPAVPAPVDAAPADAAPALRPLDGVLWQLDLLEPALDPWDVRDGGVPAGSRRLGVVAPPLGARGPRPILIALHGGSDHPEWACGAWRTIANVYPFVVCPRGPGAESSLAWSSPEDTQARIDRAIAATRAMFGGWVRDTEAVVLVGFSMGGTQTALLARRSPARYRRVVLAESAYAPEPALAFPAPWARGGGERAAFLCTTGGCVAPYRAAARAVAASHVPARLNVAGTSAHGMWDPVLVSMRRDWPWVVDGAEGWEEYVAPPPDPPQGRTETFAPNVPDGG